MTIPEYSAATPLDLALDRLDDTRAMLQLCRRSYTGALLRAGDWFTRRWLEKADFPYADEVRELAARVDLPGALVLNLSYEWGCTAGVTRGESGGPVLLRTLDWHIKGLGERLVCVRHAGVAGEYLSLTHPGFLGAHTLLAPGRFGAALNQAPLPYRGRTLLGDWLLSRMQTGRLPYCPATFLLRRAAETCPDFNAAVELLTETPLCIPAIFTVTGTEPGQAAVIERAYRQAVVYGPKPGQPAVAANHWQQAGWQGRDRPLASRERAAAMRTRLQVAEDGPLPRHFTWLKPPVLNALTRMAAELDAGTRTLRAVAVEGGKVLSGELQIRH